MTVLATNQTGTPTRTAGAGVGDSPRPCGWSVPQMPAGFQNLSLLVGTCSSTRVQRPGVEGKHHQDASVEHTAEQHNQTAGQPTHPHTWARRKHRLTRRSCLACQTAKEVLGRCHFSVYRSRLTGKRCKRNGIGTAPTPEHALSNRRTRIRTWCLQQDGT